MATNGFDRTIDGVTQNGEERTFDLPHATYYGSSTDTAATVRDRLGQLIRVRIQQNIVIFVAETTNWSIG
jgi:hypothetical protein